MLEFVVNNGNIEISKLLEKKVETYAESQMSGYNRLS